VPPAPEYHTAMLGINQVQADASLPQRAALCAETCRTAAGDQVEAEHVTVAGPRHPPALNSFQDLAERYQCSKKLLENVAAALFEQPMDVQRHAIPCVLQGLDLYVIAPTGSGKTLAFLLPGAAPS
jgi:superfamily II DNA/RNA helicase